ncbi:tRNA(Ser) Um(44) 2'-O-methyltransferase [Orbilia oligospora]|uniref:tRNA (uracil-O(2)-)-methyltransferase n=1 Tax=Orbilia oligospora TaxID=2813651 RepID=A0A7C8NMK6_ORBOL|nr:tRNA(Ser) Um(44) 2'-O-methyltransferase [Orbilia oligospora]KAF3079719.1 tRNA(Ser) Um(44) 2'-O-methyltransferase [Orbilia oligospora]KAF3095114.1 tRNA(Ser) Um(44) 2'-O-methyltransferase [Orbilia oligospora]KAF3120453.1 tRNA(Ser) Um(44) 2'-O-methyltransferase [Orbilia oligospora]KAF3120773.1 tRNA(Ser) Um(44) 2'-O-methyltransferase [Orbilia oligospora]
MEESDLAVLFTPLSTSSTSIDHTNVVVSQQPNTPDVWKKSCSIQIPESPITQSESVILGVLLQPEYLSPVIARADVIYDSDTAGLEISKGGVDIGFIGDFLTYRVSRRLIIRNIPRNPKRDEAIEQSIWSLQKFPDEDDDTASPQPSLLIVIVPHINGHPAEWPFYFPDVRAFALETKGSRVSIHHLDRARPELLDTTISRKPVAGVDSERTRRMFRRILEVLKKRFEKPDYIKRVNHDAIVSRERYQKVYQDLKARHADRLCRIFAINGYEGKGCREVDKIFEELGIASFCICLWEEIYEIPTTARRNGYYDDVRTNTSSDPLNQFVGFADLGCGSGVLTDVLLQEGWPGYGIDARSRKIWKSFDDHVQLHLIESILIPYVIDQTLVGTESMTSYREDQMNPFYTISGSPYTYHSGRFANGTFLICNHGDELTAWTPLLASLSRSPFMVVPCCSFNLAGRRFRAQRSLCQVEGEKSRESSKQSTYRLLINYVENLCHEIGVVPQKEWLRIPSTRNLAIIGRAYEPPSWDLSKGFEIEESREMVVKKIIQREGGTEGWNAMVAKLKGRQPSGADDGHSRCS